MATGKVDDFTDGIGAQGGPQRQHRTYAGAAGLFGHKNIQHTVRYTELAPTRFKDFWRD
jgi:hypothetical protein